MLILNDGNNDDEVDNNKYEDNVVDDVRVPLMLLLFIENTVVGGGVGSNGVEGSVGAFKTFCCCGGMMNFFL